MEQRKAIITDLDRTLLHTDKTISEHTLKVLQNCHDKGCCIMAATARPERAILGYHELVKFDAMTVMNGAGVILPGQEPLGYAIPRESAKVILERLCELPDFILSLELGDDVYASVEIPEWEAKVYQDFPKLPTEGPIYKILVSRENENVGPLVEKLLTEDTYCTVANDNLVQIMNKKATKWNGIQMMLEAVGISPEDAVYFGDDNDDIESLKACGVGVAVANAIDAVKEAADEITESNDEDGVARWLERTCDMKNINEEWFNMIKKVTQEDLKECVNVIRDSFATVAEEFNITKENAPRFTAFATDEGRLNWHLNGEHRPMFGFVIDGKIVGYYSLLLMENNECELNNLSVLPEYRHDGIGAKLVEHAFEKARKAGCAKMKLGIVEENQVLRKWYEKLGFIHVGTQKFDFFPFTCGYMEKML